MYKVLFVCTGNTCRSPMAEVLAREFFGSTSPARDIIFSSRGISVFSENPAGANAVLAVLLNYGLDLSGHVSKQLAETDLAEYDIALCMTAAHKNILVNTYPAYSEKVFSMSELSGMDDIADPFMGDLDVYTHCAEKIRLSIEKIDLLNLLKNDK